MDLKAKACVDRLQRQQLGLKPRGLMRSAADLDAGVEVEPGQRRLTDGRRATDRDLRRGPVTFGNMRSMERDPLAMLCSQFHQRGGAERGLVA